MSNETVNYIALAIPAFFLLIGIELLVGRLRKTPLYRFNDAVTNLNCGIGQQVIGVFIKTLNLLLYIYIYENYRWFDIPATWWVWLLLFIGVDFFYYWFHRLAHEISVLWGSHVVHHQSEEYNLSVALRQAWFQSIFSSFFYLPLALIGFDPAAFVAVNSFQTLYQFWIHTKAIGKLPFWFEYVFNTPSHHRVHHGVNPIYIDRNHGGTLIIFDRWFGTFQEEQEEVIFGITAQPRSWNPLWLNIDYWATMFRNMYRADNWSDRWHIFAHTPDWKPAAWNKQAVPPKAITPQNFIKYDTHLPQSLNYYILLQHLLTLTATTLFMFYYEGLPLLPRVLAASFVLLTLINVGALLEIRPWVWSAELLRLLAPAALSVVLFTAQPAYIILAITYTTVSALWLWREWKIARTA